MTKVNDVLKRMKPKKLWEIDVRRTITLVCREF